MKSYFKKDYCNIFLKLCCFYSVIKSKFIMKVLCLLCGLVSINLASSVNSSIVPLKHSKYPLYLEHYY